MATVVYSARALDDVAAAIGSVPGAAAAAGRDAALAIQSAVEHLAAHPLAGRRIDGELRELVISYGRTGYVALYRFLVAHDEVRVLALCHQRELGSAP